MRTLKTIWLGTLLFAVGQMQAQEWLLGGNVIGSTAEYLGAAAGSTQPLRLTTIPNQPIQFRTNNMLRMHLTPTLIGQTVNSYTGLDLSGHLGIGTALPATFLHISVLGSTPSGYRPWMRTGTLMSESTDMMYVGLKSEGTDRMDAVINWADNNESFPFPFGPDALRFIFTRNPVGGAMAAGLHGLELARMIPSSDANEGFFGIGNFFTAGVQPTERLHLLDGRARFQQLPNDPEADAKYKVMVVDDSNDPNERGVVKWKDIDLNSACDWVVQTNNDVSTVYPGSSCPWGMQDGVGVGIQYPRNKLDVLHSDYSGGMSRNAIHSRIVVDDMANRFRGIYGAAHPLLGTTFMGINSIGVEGYAANGRGTTGVWGSALLNVPEGFSGKLVGVHGHADLAAGQSNFTTGVYGSLTAPIGTLNAWAGFFAGNVHSTGTVTWVSDEHLKSDAQPITGAMDKINALDPARYTFRTEEYPQMNLPAGEHMGLISQQVQEVLPGLVTPVSHPATIDSLGTEIHPAVDYLALNYTELIPLLIAGMQEQNARIDELQDQLAACCVAGAPTAPDDVLDGDGTKAMDPALERMLLIAPNPFPDHTTVYYTLERPGRAQLLVNSADGRHIEVLHEGVMPAGAHRYEWSTAHLAPGVHYVTLLLDGEHVVKRAVKVR